jgi:hypothetical protein
LETGTDAAEGAACQVMSAASGAYNKEIAHSASPTAARDVRHAAGPRIPPHDLLRPWEEMTRVNLIERPDLAAIKICSVDFACRHCRRIGHYQLEPPHQTKKRLRRRRHLNTPERGSRTASAANQRKPAQTRQYGQSHCPGSLYIGDQVPAGRCTASRFDGSPHRSPLVTQCFEILSGTSLKRACACAFTADHAVCSKRRGLLVAPCDPKS